jgi:hemerythrin
MSEIKWDESYSVGVPILDDQHKILIGLINRLELIEQGDGDLNEIMDKLDWYVREHFSLEESMLKDVGYASLKAHITEHRDFEKWLHSAQSHMASGGFAGSIVATSIRDHLQDWLMKHILEVDMDYKDDLA